MATLNVNQAYTYTANASAPSPYNGPFTYQWAFDGVNAGTASTQAKTWTTLGQHLTACTVTNSATTEIKVVSQYDTVQGAIAAAGALPDWLVQGSATPLLSNGKVALIGGYGGTNINQQFPSGSAAIVLYDPALQTFSTGPSIPNRPTVTNCPHAAYCLMSDGRVFFTVAGPITTNAICWIYDPSAGTVTRTADCPVPMQYGNGTLSGRQVASNMCQLPDGDIVICGMWPYTTTNYRYTPSTNTWTAGPAMPNVCGNGITWYDATTGYAYHYAGNGTGVNNYDGRIYRYNKASGAWALAATHPLPTVYGAFGGTDRYYLMGCGNNGNFQSAMYKFDTTTLGFTSLTAWPQSCCYITTASTANTVVIVGGYSNVPAAITSAGKYDLVAGTQTLFSTVSYPITSNTLYIHTDGTFHAIGGYNLSGGIPASYKTPRIYYF